MCRCRQRSGEAQPACGSFENLGRIRRHAGRVAPGQIAQALFTCQIECRISIRHGRRETKVRIPFNGSRGVAMAHCLAPLIFVATTALTRADATDDYVRSQMDKKRIPGLSLAVIRNGHVVKEAAYGKASLELNVPVTLNTSFPLASMTKIFTAAAIMQIVEERKIQLDEPVSQILNGLPAQWSAVTVRHCLAHTSGLPDVLTDDVNAINCER